MTSQPAPTIRPSDPAVASMRLAVVEVTRHRPHAAEYHAYVDDMNARVQATAEAAGWQAVRLAAGDLGTAELLRATDGADAIVVLGGEDVTPRFYGGATGYPGEGRHEPVADEAQLALVRRAVARRTPLLGVCRGHQVINVALGGDLVQHLDDHEGLHRTPGAPVEQLMHPHAVSLDPGSRLARALGAEPVVQSAHHQAVGRPGRGLRVVGRADDGTVEAVEHVSAPVVGVQWHPEDRGAPVGQLEALLAQLADAVEAGRLTTVASRTDQEALVA
ncbi:gamma-glutamyl-gamma-aminobutyrate hydrolase family protein [Frigoribacterium sp. VKM Ac-1396]|uniref:gamma-glutamyl-gamma-aminobutyrate hydrolase family protein n=1 Tax=Frigoribacterium sp. VKM Ac-1396 TaxID=2783821 RepID=UPI001E313E85|nr:gamma-glutamyl-gamma-aminobutyrate hydrolase family protein [Frigoribacterium sp. VKM Ac-1396]